MYNLADFSLQDMSACSGALRTLGRHAAGPEDAADRLVRHLYDHLNDGRTGIPACALVRLFQTQPYGELSPDSQRVVQQILGTEPASRELKCLTLVGTAGEQPEWNRTEQSRRYRTIPLVSSEFVAQFPMFSQLFLQLGVNVDTTLQPQSALFVDADEHTFNVFHVSDAIGSPFVPVQQEFVVPYGIRSVVGFGGLLPSGELFVVVLFSKVFVSRFTADLFRPLALSAKLALLPFDGSPAVQPPVDTIGRSVPRSTRPGAQVAALEQLLAVHEEAVITNAAQRKHAEEALHESEIRLSAIVHSTNDVVLFIDRHGYVKSWNDAAQALFGYSIQDAYGKPCAMLIIEGFESVFERTLHEAVTGTPREVAATTYEAVGRKQDGRTFPMELNLASWHSKANFFFLATIRDMTERKRVESALEKSEARLRSLIEHAPDIVLTLSSDGAITSLNPVFETMTHWSRHEWIGKPFASLLHPDDAATAHAIFDYSLQQQCPITCVLRIRSKDRGVLMGELVGTPLIEDHQVVGLLAIARDITERKMIETALRESEEQLRSIVQSTKDAIISLDRHGQVVFWNRGAEEIFGYAAEQMLGQLVTRVIPERFREAHQQGIMRAAAAGHLTVSGTMFELVGLRQDGTEFPLEFTLAAWKAQSGVFFTGIIRDITERKRAEYAINALVQGTASVTGEEFFPVFVRQLAAALEVSYAFVTELVPGSRTRLRILASWEKTRWGKTFEYESSNTPCGIVLRDGSAFYAKDVQNAFPDDQQLIDWNIASYFATAMVSSSRETIGHVCVMDPQPLKNEREAIGLLNVFAARAAAELERVHATAALRQSEARQALILNALPMAFYTTNASDEFHATWVSDNVGPLTGFPSRAFVESPGFWMSRVHPEDQGLVLAEVNRGRDVGALSIEYRWRIADGSYRWYLDNAVYTRDAEGHPKEVVGAWIDITHRKRTEEALRESEERFKAFMDHNPAVIFIKDEQSRYVYGNAEFEQISTEAWLGKTDDQLWPHETAEQFRKNDVQVLASDSAVDTTETTLDRSGLPQYWRVIKFPIKDVVGRRFLGGIAVDTTARRRAEAALRASEERLRLSLSATGLGIWDWNVIEGNLVWSDTVATIFGVSIDVSTLTYDYYLNLVHPDDRALVMNATTCSIEEGAAYELEHRLVRPDGGIRWVACKGEVFHDENGRAVRLLGTMQDVTERKISDTELQSALTRLRTLSGRLEVIREEERGRIARELHDEFGVGLTCLKIDLSRLTSLIGPTVAYEKRHQIEEKIRSMGEFIDTTIQGVQRIVSELRPGILDDLGLVAAVEWQAQDFQRRTGIACTLCVNQERVDMEPERATVVFRICQEALTNVARHAKATVVTIRLEERRGMVILEVGDNGKGIDEDKLIAPTSLGLIGMRERAELLGGSVRIAGSPEGGTQVLLQLRAARPSVVEGSC